MEIATILNVHSNPELVLDTLDSIMLYMTSKVLVVVDGASADFNDISLPVHKMIGFRHGCAKSPYRNVALGLQQAYELWPDVDWFCYLEYDCLVTSSGFRQTLELAQQKDVWMLGCDGHVDEQDIPLVAAMLKKPLLNPYYFLGACQFFSQKFMMQLDRIKFFNRFLNITNMYSDGFMPGYGGYDVSESLYPTLARQFGGGVGVLSTWDAIKQKWHGNYQMYPIRWRPELNLSDVYPETSILHPSKDIVHEVRTHYRKVRDAAKKQNDWSGFRYLKSTSLA